MTVARLPLHEAHLRANARMDSPCGILLPTSYGDPAGEHRAARTAVGVVDRSATGAVEVTGKDRAAFLQGMLTNDIKGLVPGGGCAAAFLDAHGKVQSVLSILADDDRLLLLVHGGAAARVMEMLDRFLFSEQVELRDASGDLVLLVLTGPGTPAALAGLAGVPLPGRPWDHVEARIADAEVRIARGGGETGEAEAWLLAPRAASVALWDAVLAGGARPVGLIALDALRVEAGTPWFGHDADEGTLLPELPFEALVSTSKGCYIGQEVIVRIRDRGHVNRSLTGLTLEGEAVPRPGAVLTVAGKEVGRVTSAVRSFALDRPIALAFVRREHLAPDSSVTVADDGRMIPARVTPLPFVTRP